MTAWLQRYPWIIAVPSARLEFSRSFNDQTPNRMELIASQLPPIDSEYKCLVYSWVVFVFEPQLSLKEWLNRFPVPPLYYIVNVGYVVWWIMWYSAMTVHCYQYSFIAAEPFWVKWNAKFISELNFQFLYLFWGVGDSLSQLNLTPSHHVEESVWFDT